MLWLTAVSALTPHLLLKLCYFFYIDNAKAPNITNLHKLVANHLFCHELRYFENIIKMMVAFFLTEQSIVKDGEVIYLFLHFLLLLFFVGLLMFFLWLLFLLLFFWLFFCYVAARFQARTS